jgi:creatinine amidohydrolase/Fe(II)-dependent formamide hydrolase-like protein
MNTRQIVALNRDSTVVILPYGILEQHGPYLPSYADGFVAERLTRDMGDTLARRGWSVLIFPVLPLGHGGANVIGGKFVYPGSYTVRASTVRAVTMDLLTELGEQGFRHVILISLHGAPDNNRALTQAAQYFEDEFGGRALNLFDVVFLNDIDAKVFPRGALTANGFSVHAGLRETSDVMFVRPDLVAPEVRAATPLRGASLADLIEIARAPAWPGYFGAPHLARKDYGEQSLRAFTDLSIATAMRFLAGKPLGGPLYTVVAAGDSASVRIDNMSRERDRAIAERQRRWLARRGVTP